MKRIEKSSQRYGFEASIDVTVVLFVEDVVDLWLTALLVNTPNSNQQIKSISAKYPPRYNLVASSRRTVCAVSCRVLVSERVVRNAASVPRQSTLEAVKQPSIPVVRKSTHFHQGSINKSMMIYDLLYSKYSNII